jgi:hypothetical protein
VSVQSAKQSVVNNPCAATAAVVGAGIALVTWLVSVVGIDLPGWVAALVAGGVVSFCLTISAEGLNGIVGFVLYGRNGKPGGDA